MKHQKDIEWTSLENASKIFPATWSVKDPKVFRLVCELYEAVDSEFLQKALDRTIDDYPLYRSVMRTGIFWYYLEASDIRPEVQIESDTVCAPIYLGHKNNLLFRVIYYKNRINLEVFHALSDGTGAVRFLQALVYYYLMFKHEEKFANTILVNDHSSISGLMDDSFDKYFVGGSQKNSKMQTPKAVRAYQIHGVRRADNRLNLIEGSMSTQNVLNEAHKYHTTLTVFLTSLYIYAIGKDMHARKKIHPVILTVPVNLRQYYESVTARNFFSCINIGYSYEKDTDDLKTVIESVSDHFKKYITVEYLNNRSNKYMAMEQNLLTRIIPLPIKDLILRIVAGLARRQTTSTVSNLGKISMPTELHSAIRQFSACISARRPQMTLCSYGDRLVVSISSPYRETNIQRTFFRLLSKAEIEIEISSNI
ncbi:MULTISPECIES: hypothetical protein [unclassified Dehalobacter]|uniref:hypothetical protein n=1 Tax=unclassified Dehalobacter TaxID=2635733 RepID=UPI000E6BFA5F|nr:MULTISPECIES: hypothetical protein [unclassified Dehalobacter]RJE46672.1 hypothetical protein A7K50_13015 [Dehalobacter sp. MCB1]TCX47439.1 hypothetical protein C1I36_14185 [Dehalobacter sp. 14DCB1]TCX55652.1 hypothetical protein C1I38_03150 [Dehalobacter sp. 12DCB1]